MLFITNMYPARQGDALVYGIFVRNEVEGLKKLGVQVDLVAKNTFNPLLYIPFVIQSIYKLLFTEYDIIHAHYVPHSALIPAILKTKPLIVTFHGTDGRVYPWKNKVNFLLTKFVVDRSDKIVSPNNEIKKMLVDRMNVDPLKIHALHHGTDTEIFKPVSKQYARKVTKLPASKHVVLFVGTLARQKGISYILRAAQKRPDVLFVLIGRGQLNANLKNCLILEQKRHEDLPVWMCAADVLVLPSETEGTPSVIQESLACGTPVVASDVGGCPEAVRDGKTGYLIPVGNVDALADRIKCLLDNREMRLDMGKAGRQDMLKRYNARVQVKMLKQIYKTASGNTRSGQTKKL